jgi:hypothetical protein
LHQKTIFSGYALTKNLLTPWFQQETIDYYGPKDLHKLEMWNFCCIRPKEKEKEKEISVVEWKKHKKCWFNKDLWAVSESIMKESPSQNNHEQPASKRFYHIVFGGEGPKICLDHISNQPLKNKISHKRCNITPPFLLSFFVL